MLKSRNVFRAANVVEASSSLPNYDHVIWPAGEKPHKLKFVNKVPVPYRAAKPPKMTKLLHLMRGAEEVHNKLIHKQYGIVAKQGGRLKHSHFEMIRLKTTRVFDFEKIFAIWRVEPPWQSVTKKTGRGGGGKGNINHYVSPVKNGRVILEVGGNISFDEVSNVLQSLAERMPFRAEAVSQEMLEAEELKEEKLESENLNPLTMKYCILNNIQGCNNFLSPRDWENFGKNL